MTMVLLHRRPVSLRRATATTSAAQPAHERPVTGGSTNVTEYGFHIGHFDVKGGGMANDFQPNITFNEWEE